MKQLIIFLISLLTTLSVHAHKNVITGVVTITVNGNKNLQIAIDGKDYNMASSDVSGNQTTIFYNSLEAGQHTIQVIRTDRNTNRSNSILATFNLRYGYDMLIKVNENGSLELIETIKTGIADNGERMSDANFNVLFRTIRNQRSSSKRSDEITNALGKTNNYFTTNQVFQLLQLVNSESSRIQLAKLSYPLITDRSNFYQLYDLVKSQAGQHELEDYVNNYNKAGDLNMGMSDVNFNTLYQSIKNQWNVSSQINSLTNAFNITDNNFTTSQAIQLIQIVSTESDRLKLAKLSYRSIVDPNNFNQVYSLLNSQSSQNELAVYVNNYNAGNGTNNAMSDANFNTLYQDIKNQWNVNIQMTSLTNAFNTTNNYFSSHQASQLIQIVSTESDRLKLAKLSYRSIVDPNNFNQVYSLLNSQSSQNELAVYVNNYNAGNGTNNAMTDANFNTLYQDIKNQWNDNTQMTSLTNAFNTTNNYFSSYQASQLIQLVSSESNRLQLAKLSYRSITDPGNFNQVYNLLNSQTSQNELAVYISNYNAGNGTNNAMSDANFNSLYQDIKNQWNDNTQMTSLSNAFNNTNNYFSSYQASQLIQLVSVESNRLEIAKLSYRSITDPGNFNQVVSLISSQTGKNELTAYINNNYNTGSSPNVAMSDANFTTLIQGIERQFLPFEQMYSLTDAFNNTSNYFTTAQAKQLIPLVSNESNRLQLAKLSYRTITDRINFIQLNSLLSNQSSRNELDAYVKAYKD